ncbi:MAG: hypothetical protein WCP19_16165 [Chloroflexota bacterium]
MPTISKVVSNKKDRGLGADAALNPRCMPGAYIEDVYDWVFLPEK